MKKLTEEKTDRLGQSGSTVQRIVKIAEGIKDDDWLQVLQYAGPEAYKFAVKIVIAAVVPGAAFLAPLTGPVIDRVVDSNAGFATDLITAAKNNDPVKGGEVVAEFVMSYYLIYGCALIPDGAVKEATCGKLEKIIGDIAGIGGGVVRDILEGTGINDLLKASGVTGLVDAPSNVVGNALARQAVRQRRPEGVRASGSILQRQFSAVL